MLPEHETPAEQKNVTRIYGALVAGTFLSVLPSIMLALVGTGLLLGVLIAAYVIRARAKDPDSLSGNHMTYLIRTFWVSGLILGIGMAAAGIYLSRDMGAETYEMLRTGNFQPILTVTIAYVVPGMAYYIYRVGKGLARAVRGYRIANPKSWL